jgi:hypothetical protein
MSRDHQPPLRDVTADTENTASSIAELPSNRLFTKNLFSLEFVYEHVA